MSNRGWIKLWAGAAHSTAHRRDAITRAVMLTLFSDCARCDGDGLKAGQWRGSVRAMAEDMGEPADRVYRALRAMASEGMVSMEGLRGGRRGGETLITLENFAKYQASATPATKAQQKSNTDCNTDCNTDEPLLQEIYDDSENTGRNTICNKSATKAQHAQDARAIEAEDRINNTPSPRPRAHEPSETASNAPPAVPAGEDGGGGGDGPQSAIPGPSRPNLATATESQLARFPGFRPAAPYPQTAREVMDAAAARGLAMPEAEAEAFLDHFTGRGWVDAQGQPIVDWRCSLRRWMRRANETTQTGGHTHADTGRPGAGNALRYVGGRAEPSYDYSHGGGLTEADLDALLGLGPRPAGAGGA